MHRVQRCNFCVLDSTVTNLEFDDSGQCHACKNALVMMPHEWLRDKRGEEQLFRLASELKRQGEGKAYDAMIGLSGGVDSAYLAHIAVNQMGLRVLAVHVDGGWNNAAAVKNIESLVNQLNIDLHTVVIEWEEMRDLQLAFLRSGVFNQDIPQDHAFFSTLYRTAIQFKQSHFLSGVNFSSEGVTVKNLGFPAMDGVHVRAIHRMFGQLKLNSYPIMGLSELIWLTKIKKQLTVHRILDYIDYNKRTAIEELAKLCGWEDYGHKHCESRFTKFYQEVYLPRKFNFDKRAFHLSSLIVSGQMTRGEALAELEKPITSALQMKRDIKYVSKKLGISELELNQLIDAAPVKHTEYKSQQLLHSLLTGVRSNSQKVIRWFQRESAS